MITWSFSQWIFCINKSRLQTQQLVVITNSVSAEECSNENKIDDIKSLITQAFDDLEKGKVNPGDLQFTVKISKEAEEYKNENDRVKTLAKSLNAHKGDLIYWYESSVEDFLQIYRTLVYKHTSKSF